MSIVLIIGFLTFFYVLFFKKKKTYCIYSYILLYIYSTKLGFNFITRRHLLFLKKKIRKR
jgi:hypothetical protein